MRRFLILSLLSLPTISAADDTIDRTGNWDVNGPMAPSSTLEFTTDEGTWMNLDVHPDGDKIIFDILGDLYLVSINGGSATRLTEGAAMDLQARFSPDGTQVLFSSDRGGNVNIWRADFDGEALSEIRVVSEQNSNLVNGGNWMADGEWILARKRVTDTSSIGVSELWMYHKDGGSGIQLIADKGEVDSFSGSADGRYIYLGTSGGFSYGRNPHRGVWSITRYDRKTGEKRPVTGGNGSAASPKLSPDGQSIAFVRRVGTDSTLWIHDLNDGSERQVWDGLDRDQIEGFGTHYIYPGYDWTPDGQDLIVWADGHINSVAADGSGAKVIPFEADVSLRYREPLRSKRDPLPDQVQAKLIRWPVISPDGNTLVFNAFGHLYHQQLPDGTPQRVTDASDLEFSPVFSPDGRKLAYTTWNDANGGKLQVISMRRGRPGSSTTMFESPTQLVNPAFSADGESLLVVAGSGANLRGQTLGAEQRHDIFVMNASGRGEATLVTSTTNRGANTRITRPSFSADGERIWFYDSEAVPGERGSRQPDKTVLLSIKLDGTDKKSHMGFRYAQDVVVSPDGSMVAFTELHNAYVTALPRTGTSIDFDPSSAAFPFQELSQDGGEWPRWSADGKTLSWSFGQKVHRASTADLELAPKAPSRDSGDHGIDIFAVGVNSDGQYQYGDADYNLESLKAVLEGAWQDSAHARVDVMVDEAAPYSAWTELNAWMGEAKVAVKQVESEGSDAEADEASDEESNHKFEPETFDIDLALPAAKPAGSFALTGARIITMDGDQVIDDGTVVVSGNRITAVGPSSEVAVPADAERFDVSGKTIMPGLIDVHAHLGYNSLDVNPQKDWQYYANLAYGITTVHDPSASTHLIFSQSEMVAAGVMTGPRIFSTGFILYGAQIADKAPVSSYADALSHVRRLKSQGAFSVKSYEQPRRDQRQWIIRAAAAEDMLVVPEGGGDFPKNVGMVIDGHSGIEHAMSPGKLYKDVVTLFAESDSGYTATLLVAYAGLSGERWFYQHYDAWKNEKLQSFFPPRSIDAISRRRSMAAEDDYNHKNVAGHLKDIDDSGGLVTMGAHGQLQGLGSHWELWAMTHGGMQPHAALRAATLNGAIYLGMEDHLGSISAGKLADLVVLDENPLEKIENTDSVDMTVINGVVYDADSMDQVWPEQVERGRFLFQ